MQALARSGVVAGIAFASVGMIVFAQFPPPPCRAPTPGAIRLTAGLAPVEALEPPALGTGFDDVLASIQGSVDSSAPPAGIDTDGLGDLVPMSAAELGDFNPIGLLLLPLFPLALVPLFFTFAGSLVAFLLYSFSPGPETAEAVAVDLAPADVDVGAALGSVADFPS